MSLWSRLELLDVSDIPDNVGSADSKVEHRLGIELIEHLGKDLGTPSGSDDVRRKIARMDLDAHEKEPLRNLKILDLSGLKANFDSGLFSGFLKNHDKLEFLGLLMTNASMFEDVIGLENIKVAGEANTTQILCAASTYSVNNREYFCSRSLYNAFHEINHRYQQFSKEDLRILLEAATSGLQQYQSNLSVQMAGTACVYNLCNRGRVNEWHPDDLKVIVDRCLDAAVNHPTTMQLHKNVWLTICNDIILQATSIDMFRCCCVALESMCNNNDPAVTRMTVAIVSILAAKVPTEKMWNVGNNERYMRFLVGVVKDKLGELEEMLQLLPAGQPLPPPDVTLKFTLSALWNLTDESPVTCEQFLKQKGLDTVLDVLDRCENYSVRTKVLGLMNNVAEVAELQKWLLTEKCLSLMLMLLEEEKIEVSYFSAGVLANLGAKERWEVAPDWNTCMSALIKRIGTWTSPDSEMVAYRSFRPFFPLLGSWDIPGVQLWAVWAIRHVCSKNADRYRDMFQEQGGVRAVEEVLRKLEQQDVRQLTHGQLMIKEITAEILDLIGN